VFDEYEETGEASWYGHPYHGRRTASGEIFDMYQMTAAHRTLPFGTWVLVENSANGQSVKVRINDRGPFRSRRILDVSYAAARALGALGPGVIPVRLRVIASPGATRVGGRWAIPQGEGESP
jgi:rare lipoprotein A